MPTAWLRGAVFAAIARCFPRVPTETVEGLRRRLAAPGDRPLLLDARRPEEFAVGHLAGAENAPDLPSALAAIARAREADPDRPVVVYCSVGWRSGRLAARLVDRGVPDVANLEGSIFAWANAGLPVHDRTGPVDRVHPYDRLWGLLLDRSLHARAAERDTLRPGP
jgi:rhodanese-related sulfurtransferase